MMLASFVVCFHTARIDNLLQTLRFLCRDHREVVERSFLSLACQDSTEDLPASQIAQLNDLRSIFSATFVLNANLNRMELPKLTNLAVNNSPCDKLVILESDRILPKGYFSEVIKGLREGIQVTCKKMKKLSHEATDEEIDMEKFNFKEEFRDEKNRPGLRNSWSGNTVISKKDYEVAGGMDEAYCGYGWADSDMTNRTEANGILSVYREETEIHLWHPPLTYGKGNQKELFFKNGLHFCRKWRQDLPEWFRKELAQKRTSP